jgi:hypothetical protein
MPAWLWVPLSKGLAIKRGVCLQHYPAEEVLERDYQRREAIEEKMLQ